MFFVLANSNSGNKNLIIVAEFEVDVVELVLYIITTLAVIVAMLQMRVMKYHRKHGGNLKDVGGDWEEGLIVRRM